MDAKRFMCPFGQAARGQCCLLTGYAAEIHSLNRYPSFRFRSAVVNAVVIHMNFKTIFGALLDWSTIFGRQLHPAAARTSMSGMPEIHRNIVSHKRKGQLIWQRGGTYKQSF